MATPPRGAVASLVLCAAACSSEPIVAQTAPPSAVPSDLTIHVKPNAVVNEVDPAYLSYTVDVDQVTRLTCTGCTSKPLFDFAQRRLATLARALNPAMLRIGGTAADGAYYDMGANPVTVAPAPYRSIITRTQWDPVCAFAKALDLKLLFTLNAGQGPRVNGKWTPANARSFIEYTLATACPVKVWELGNEINAYFFSQGAALTGSEYAADMAVARTLVSTAHPQGLLAGPSSAYWPLIGEPLPVMPTFMPDGGKYLDVLTWHYYPQQSDGCPVQTVLAKPETMLDPANLDEIVRWATEVNGQAKQYAPQAQVWLGETGHAQCGGQAGVSGTFVSSLWWMDQLGLMATMGQKVSMRQDLVGDHYQLIDRDTLEPTPDYYTSVMWKQLMGTKVLQLDTDRAAQPKVRGYAHCTGALHSGSATVLLINLDKETKLTVGFDAALGTDQQRYTITSPSITSKTALLNGTALSVASDGSMPALAPVKQAGPVELPPLSITFVVLPSANLAVCN